MRRDSQVARSERSCDIKSAVAGSVSGGIIVDSLTDEVRAESGIDGSDELVVASGMDSLTSMAGSGGSSIDIACKSGVSVRDGTSLTSNANVSFRAGESDNLGVSVRTGELDPFSLFNPFDSILVRSALDRTDEIATSSLEVTIFGLPVRLFAIEAARRSCNVILPAATLLCTGVITSF